MPRARKLLERSRAVKKIRTVTRTMEMVATSQFRRLHQRVVAARRYTDRMAAMVADVVRRGGIRRVRHPLLETGGRPARDVLLVITSSRGLCGAYNAGVIRTAEERIEQLAEAGYEVALHAAGKRGLDHLRRGGFEIQQTYDRLEDPPEFTTIAALADTLAAAFEDRAVEGVEVAYTQFISSGQQRPAIAQLLPLTVMEARADLLPPTRDPVPYEFIPSADEVLRQLLPATVRMRLYQCFLDAAISEHVARMTAMRSATESADEMIHDLTVHYNRTRQAQITTELAEVFGGRGDTE